MPQSLVQDYEMDKCLQMLLISKNVGELLDFSYFTAPLSSHLSHLTPS